MSPRLVPRRGTTPSARRSAHALATRASRSCDTPEATSALLSRRERDRGEAVPSRTRLSGFSGRSENHDMLGDDNDFEILEASAHSSRRWMDLEAAELHAARARGVKLSSLQIHPSAGGVRGCLQYLEVVVVPQHVVILGTARKSRETRAGGHGLAAVALASREKRTSRLGCIARA